MSGQETQTIRLPITLSDSLNLEKIGSLPGEVKRLAQEFKAMLEKELEWR